MKAPKNFVLAVPPQGWYAGTAKIRACAYLTMIPSTNSSPHDPIVTRLKASKATRRRREIALLILAAGLAAAALVLNEPVLVLVSVFPALASYGQR